jgi:hypothetical protein
MSTEIEKEAQEVNRTSDYSKFKMLKSNRPLTESHVGYIVKSIEDNGSWLQDEPILVNEDMEVVDGQHRLEAHRRSNLPIYYKVVQGVGIERAHAMNRARRNWTLVDWMNSYANGGNINYQNFVKLYEANEQFSIVVLLAACAEKPLMSSLSKQFRNGELSLSEEEVKAAQKKLDMLAQLEEIAPNFINGTTSRFVLQVFTHPKYDHARMVKKMTDQGGDTFVPSIYIGTVLAQLERAYNRGTELGNMVRFL